MATKIYSANAEEEARVKLNRIRLTLEAVKVALGKYESLQRFHYGHVGDLGHIEILLTEAHLFIQETED